MKKKLGLLLAISSAACLLSGCQVNPNHEEEQKEEGHHEEEEHHDEEHVHVYTTNPHKCDECGEETTCVDSDIDGVCDICDEEWADDTKEFFNSFLGECLPFFKVTKTFEEKSSYIEATVSGDASTAIINSFLKTGSYTSEIDDYFDQEATFLRKPCNNDEFSEILVMVLYNEASDTTFVDVYVAGVQIDEFPKQEVLEVLDGYTEETPVFPTDGDVFIFEKGEEPNYCIVTYNGYAESYLTQLKKAGYYIDESMINYSLYPSFRALSPGRSLAINITDKTSEVSVEFMGVEVPNETEWNDSIKSYMTTLFNEVTPFANAGFTVDEKAGETIEEKGYFQLESFNIDAFKYAVEAMRTDKSFKEEYEEDGGFYTFSKMVGPYKESVVVSVLWSVTTMSFIKGFPTYKTWPAEQIDSCLGITHTDEIPAALGDSFFLYYEDAHPNIANVTVYTNNSGDYEDYLDDLKTAGYKVALLPDGWHEALSKNEQIQIYLQDDTKDVGEGGTSFYKVEIHVFEEEQPVPHFPWDAVKEELDIELDLTDLPVPTGEWFTPSYPYGKGTGASDITITISGGDRDAYLTAIGEAGYEHYSSWDARDYKCYVNWDKHIAIYVYDNGSNTDYAVEYGIAFKL